MAIQFCDVCGDTLPVSKDEKVCCECCGTSNKNTLLNSVTVSSTSNFPSDLRKKRTINAPKPMSSTDTWSTTDLTCPECQAKEVRYTTLQLRSADEGSTMFYFCPDCSARIRWNENN
ncbi:transcription factor s-II (TFIIS) domain-containing protein [Hirsutella rhossiliensis]|uniref:DNA-directed RNA polymerase subunit n=1 Tax=Hirsutella rhossiliensis TaxID=111463 RepID=A0A9P8N005_9HYPO|nr:transcription factor s-II (TFIIS) domain-containing protein [Hirsutella rhossiliensis]KAH0963401.1 transcription factor s-II (TFIIS) domain-containing protein [Hirsutella rhossiliensis]